MTTSVVPRPVRFAFTLWQTRISHPHCRPCKQFNDTTSTELFDTFFLGVCLSSWILRYGRASSCLHSRLATLRHGRGVLSDFGVYTSLLALRRKRLLYSTRCSATFSLPSKRPSFFIPHTVPRSSNLQPVSPFDTWANRFFILALEISSSDDYTTQHRLYRRTRIYGLQKGVHAKLIRDGWTGFSSWRVVSQIFRVCGGGIGFSFCYGGLT